MKRRCLNGILLILACVMISACQGGEAAGFGGTRAWIDIPRDRSVLSLTPHQIIAHVSDESGLRLVELVVNGESYGAMPCENASQPLVACRMMWSPPAPGEYRLEIRATNPNGNLGLSTPVNVVVKTESIALLSPTSTALEATRVPTAPRTATVPVGIESVPTFTTTPTLNASRVPASISPTGTRPLVIPSLTALPLSTHTSSPTRTPTQPPTDTPTRTATPACPGAPTITSFTVASSAIVQGQSSTLSWGAVLHATWVEIDHGIGGVGTPGSRQVSRQTTTTFTLTARGCGGTVTRQVTLTVLVPSPTPTRTPLPDTQGPPAPQIVLPANDALLNCTASVKLVWNTPTDVSGIANYRVRLQKRAGGNYADEQVWDPVTFTQLNATNETECGNFYRWRVLARDGAGNQGEVSVWAYFSIKLD